MSEKPKRTEEEKREMKREYARNYYRMKVSQDEEFRNKVREWGRAKMIRKREKLTEAGIVSRPVGRPRSDFSNKK